MRGVNGELRGRRKAPTIEECGQQHQHVPRKHGVAQFAVPKAGDQQHEARDKQGDGAPGKPKGPTAARHARRFHGLGLKSGLDQELETKIEGHGERTIDFG